MKHVVWIRFLVLFAMLAGARAQPAAAADLRSSMQTASATVTSFKMLLTGPMGFTSTATFIRAPLRVHAQGSAGSMSFDSYVADGVAYGRAGDRAWHKHRIPAEAGSTDILRTMTNGAKLQPGADVVDGGTTYGTFRANLDLSSLPSAPPLPPIGVTCEYDKKTFLTHSCKNSFVTLTFLAYNDPANAIALPPTLSSATEGTF